jgi:hypothetical protein
MSHYRLYLVDVDGRVMHAADLRRTMITEP